jgi:ribose transport system substrate-binding protein
MLETVLRACDVLHAFQFQGEVLRLRDLISRTDLNKTTLFRLLQSLAKGGLLERTASGRYRSIIKPVRSRSLRFGFAGQGIHSAFSREVTNSIIQAADQEGIDLIALDNSGSRRIALANADKLIKARVDLAIEYQQYEQIAPAVAAKFREANIPLIAVGFPHPGGIYYGANNYDAGLIGGRALGDWAKHNTHGSIEELILLGRPLAGPVPQSRLKGIEMGLRETLPTIQHCRIVHLNGDGQFSRSLDAIRKYVRHNFDGMTLVGAINDASALGALCAFHEVGRASNCAVISQGASAEGRAELRRHGSRLVGSVGYFPEKYGPDLIGLGLKILQKMPVFPAMFVKHVLITSENVDHFYPNDALLGSEDLENMLLQFSGYKGSAELP